MRHGVILAGGGGNRLWPASRRARPKQFVSLVGEHSLLAMTWERLGGLCQERAIVTASEQAAACADDTGAKRSQLILEPAARGTAAAIALAAAELEVRDPDAIVGIFPADHFIGAPERFANVVEKAFSVAEKSDAMVVVGITPSRPDTGYGYIEVGEPSAEQDSRPVARFVEKPDAETALEYLKGGKHVWNSGMLFSQARVLMAAVQQHQVETAKVLRRYQELLRSEPAQANAFLGDNYPGVPKTSFDYGVLEHMNDLRAVCGEFAWSDVGEWAAVGELLPKKDGNTGDDTTIIAIDSTNNVALTDDAGAVAFVGVEDLIVVKWGNAVLVANRAQTQRVRDVVDELKKRELTDFL